MKIIGYLPRLVLLFVLPACGYNDAQVPNIGPQGAVPANTDISQVRRSVAGTQVFTEDWIVHGYITANDLSGNFYRSFIIEDPTGAVEVRVGLYDLHRLYPQDTYAAVKLNGLAVGYYNGVLQAGLNTGYQGRVYVGYMDHRLVAARYVYPADLVRQLQPAAVEIDALSEQMCGRLVKIGPLRYDGYPSDRVVPPVAWAGARAGQSASNIFRSFSDRYGRNIAVCTSIYADFAEVEIPAGELYVTGILMYGSAVDGQQMYYIKMRTDDDVQQL